MVDLSCIQKSYIKKNGDTVKSRTLGIQTFVETAKDRLTIIDYTEILNFTLGVLSNLPGGSINQGKESLQYVYENYM